MKTIQYKHWWCRSEPSVEANPKYFRPVAEHITFSTLGFRPVAEHITFSTLGFRPVAEHISFSTLRVRTYLYYKPTSPTSILEEYIALMVECTDKMSIVTVGSFSNKSSQFLHKTLWNINDAFVGIGQKYWAQSDWCNGTKYTKTGPFLKHAIPVQSTIWYCVRTSYQK